MKEEINHIGLKKYCSNNLINCILASYEKKLTALSVKSDFKAAVPEDIGVAGLDICRLLTNILDNALNALKAQSSGQKMLEFEAHIDKGYLYISESNTYSPVAEPERQKDRGNGTKIMSEIAKKYNGIFETSETDGRFNVLATVAVTAKGVEPAAAYNSTQQAAISD